MKNAYKHITENITAIKCPVSVNKSELCSESYKTVYVDRKTFEMLLQDSSSHWRVVFRDKKLQVYGTFKGKHDRLARFITNTVEDKHRSVYIVNRNEFDLRTDNLVVDLRGKHLDNTLKEKLEKIRLTLTELPIYEFPQEEESLSKNKPTPKTPSTSKLNRSESKFKLYKEVKIEAPNGNSEKFVITTSEEEQLFMKLYQFVTSNS